MAHSEASTGRLVSDEQTAATVAVARAPEPAHEPAHERDREPRREAPIVLERYRLHRQLGAGGFGTVWMARDEHLERDVAVKIVPRERIVGGRFEREARAAARLSHPGIVTLYEAGADDDGAYLVSELVRGSTLGELLEAGRLSDQEIVAIGIALCDALSHAHAENVVHRDVKPSNVLVPTHPATPASVAKLTDFGVARIVGGDSLTRTGDVVGTAAYMAPEQAEGREVGTAADLYALALVLYEALTGVNPVRTGTAAQRARRLGAHLPPLRRQRHELPRELGQALDLALRPRPRERGTVHELRRSLAGVIGRMSDEPGVVAPVWRPRRAEGIASAIGPAIPSRMRDAPFAPEEPAFRDRAAATENPAAIENPDERNHDGLAATPVRWPERGLAALATAGLAAWLVANLMPGSPVAPLVAAWVAGTVVAALPGVGWLVFVVAVAGWLLVDGRTGAALLLALGGLLPVFILPWQRRAWALPVAAPALGAIGLAGAWPALAGRVRRAPTRAALGALGWAWTMLGTTLSGTDLYLRTPSGSAPPDRWTSSAGVAVHHVLEPLISSGALAPAAVWALAAVILPWIVRGRRLALDFVLASAWAAGLVAATYAALRMVHSSLAGAPLRGGVLGGVAAFAIVLVPSILRTLRAGRVSARVP